MSEQSGPITRERWRDELAAAEPVRRVARWDAERASGIGAYVCTPPYEFVGSPGHQHPIIPSQQRHLLEAAGYEIEGGPEPVRDWKSDRAIAAIWPTPKPAEDSPERLRERRERLGLSVAWVEGVLGDMNLPGYGPAADDDRVSRRQRREAAEGVDHHDYGTAREADLRARYAAALSAEEARRAAVGAWAAGGGVLHYSPPTEPERPAPRFKVGDWVVDYRGTRGQIERAAWSETQRQWRYVAGPIDYPEAHLEPASPPAPEVVPIDTSGPVTIVAGDGMRIAVNGIVLEQRSYVAQPGDMVSAVAWVEAPEPAPEVVDVPQPRIVVKRCDEVEAEWTSADATILIVTHDALDDAIFVPIALLRAMLAAIDAQQGGAS